MKKKFLSFMLACLMVITAVSLPASAETGEITEGNATGGAGNASGIVSGGTGSGAYGGTGSGTTVGPDVGTEDDTEGDAALSGTIGSVNWVIEPGTSATGGGQLVISGSGEVPDYTIDNPAPWAENRNNINEIYIEEGITGIGDFAFYGLKYVHFLSIPETLETIGNGVFAGISWLSEIKIAEGNKFFCEKDSDLLSKDNKTLILKTADNSDNVYFLPESVTAIAPYAFYMNTVLRKVFVGNQLESIGESAFAQCNEDIVLYYTGTEAEWNEKVVVGENNGSISSIVYESKRVSAITLSSSELELKTGESAVLEITPIPQDASITDVIWTVDDYNIASVTDGTVQAVNAGITTVRATSKDGKYVAKCKVCVSAKGNLTTSVAWEVSPDLKTLTVSGSGEVPDYSGTGYAPWEMYRQNIEKIVVENGITKIGNYGFAETKCREVILPEGLISIGKSAFCFSENLEKINFPSGLASIGGSAFSACTKIESVNLPDTVTYIGEHAFNNCAKMVSLRLPEAIESIPNGTFNCCQSLKAVKIPDSVKTIGNYAFCACNGLETVVIGSALESVGYGSFYDVSLLENVYYTGTSESWGKISFEGDNDSIQNASIIYGYEPVTKVQLDKSELLMNVKDTKKLSALFTPENASMPYAMWSSSDESVAVVDAEGNVTAKARGTAQITATAICENVSASCSVVTENVPVTGMVIEETSVDMIKGEEYQLTLIFSPENATNRNIKWTSDDEDVVVVSGEGLLEAVGEGTAIVTGVTEEGEYTDSVSVTVRETIAEGVLDGGITWRINFDGNLTVGGTGEMPDFYPTEVDNDSTGNGTAAGGSTDKDNSAWSETLAPWFDYSEKIKTVTVEDGITSVGDYAFAYLYSLENAYIAFTVTDIGKNAFENSALMNIFLPESVTSIGERAFAYNHRLSSVYLPSNLKTIGKNAFEGCWGITGITLPQSLESIGSYAFSSTGINYISIPQSVKTIGEGAFARMSSLGSIVVESTESSFTVYNEILYDKDMTRLLCSPSYASAGHCELPSTVKKIDAGAFSNNYNLNSIALPQGLTTIGDEAFSSCSSLASIFIPDSVTTIGKSAFSSCGFNYFNVPEGVTEISEGMLSNCWNLQNVYMHDSVTKIGANAFSGSPLSNNFTFPKGIKEIGSHAFSNCQIGGDVRLPEGLEKIGERAFMHCLNINQVYIPASVISIGESAFVCDNLFRINVDEGNSAYTDIEGALYNKELTSILSYPASKMGTFVAPDSIKRVESDAFNRSKLSKVILPDGVTYIGNNAFSQCPNLVSIRIPDSVTSMGYDVFSNNALLRSVGLPAGITKIPSSTFNNCAMLESVTLGKNVKTIEWNAFYNCMNLRVIKISSALEEIKPYAFSQANNLSEIIYEGSAESWSNITIGEQNDALSTARLTTDAKFVLGVTLDKKNVNLKIGDTLQLAAVTSPEAVTDTLVWNSEDILVASVENGLITAEDAGNTTVTVSSSDGSYIDYCNVSVSTEGSIGEGIKWSLSDGVLTVSGEGEIPDYDEAVSRTLAGAPWSDYRKIIKTIIIGEGITAIGNNAFRDNWNAESIVISQTVQSIGDRAFAVCESVKEINIPKNVKSIGEEAFEGMWELKGFKVDAGNEHFSAQDGVLFNKEKTVLLAYPMEKQTEMYKIPAGVKEIADSALRRNQYLQVVVMPEGLTSIGAYAFADIFRLRGVIMPASIKNIGQGIFIGSALNVIVYGGNDEEYEELISQTTDNLGLPAAVHVVYNSTMPVNGVMNEPIIENGQIKVNVWFETMFEECKVIFAVYDEKHKLVKTTMQNVSDETTAIPEFRADVEGEALGYTVKVFFWDKSNSMRILGKPLEYYISPTIDVDEVLESPHDYVSGQTVTKIYESPVGTKLEITFDELTETEENVDFIYIYDEKEELVGKYTGTQLAGKTITIPGRKVIIKLTSDENIAKYGFKTSKIVVYK